MPLGLTASLKASVSGASVPLAPPANVTPCSISLDQATSLVGDSCSVSAPGVWSDPAASLTYQWYRNDSPIWGETGTTYVFTELDADQAIYPLETANNGAGSDSAPSSNNITPAALSVPVESVPAIIGWGVADEIVITTNPVWINTNPPTITGTNYQWQEGVTPGEWSGLGVTTASLRVAYLQAGYYYRVLITATNATGDSLPSASNAYQY
mgnify:FL=1